MFRLLGGGASGDFYELPRAQLAVLPGTTHLTLMDRTDWLYAMGEAFLSAPVLEAIPMCRNIKPLFNFAPPASEDEMRAAALQFVRKVSGFQRPSRANEAAFNAAVDDITRIVGDLLGALESSAEPKDRQVEAARAQARSAQRFGQPAPTLDAQKGVAP